ncbi:MAG: MarC family protein [Candidatus Omnitrophica bacterium]|nr:MarC family protein [Candidatus Omnitrophota bacterium]MBU4478641.1 MarC family protein [Candidatus Omnitrophota bacterium]
MNPAALFKSIIILFAIINPVGSIPIFLQLTQTMPLNERGKAFRTGIIASLIILFAFIITGERLLTLFFQINLSDLMAAGGLLLLIIAIDHLVFGSLVRGVLTGEQQDPHHIGAVPIACPILAGPGAMMSVLFIYSEHGFFTAAAAILIVLGITWLIFRFIDKIYGFFGKIACTVLSKILCLFIAAIGIRLLMQGLSHYFK